MKVSEIMTTDVVTLTPDQTLEQAARMLVENKISGAPVVEGEKVVGMISERDLLRTQSVPRPPRYLELLGGIIFLDNVDEFKRQLELATAATVKEVMTRKVHSVTPDAPLLEAINLIVEHQINRVPVVNTEGKLVGIITRSDALRGAME